ncbi:MAG: hypothetical protein V4642_07220 [Bacteroidota bacterium]
MPPADKEDSGQAGMTFAAFYKSKTVSKFLKKKSEERFLKTILRFSF